MHLFCFLDGMVTFRASSSVFLLVEAGVGSDVEILLESRIDEGEGETLTFLTLVDFFVDSFGLVVKDADMGLAVAVASLVGLVADLWEDGVTSTCLNLFLPLVSRVDLLRFGVCTLAAALLVSLALASFLAGVEEEAAAAAEGGDAPEPAAAPPPPPDRVLAMDQ